jgi:hemolysin III
LIILHKRGRTIRLINSILRSENSNIQIKQELVNSIVHGFGIIFGVVSIPILIALAIKSENMAGIVGAAYSILFYNFSLFYTLPWNSAYTSKTHT